MNDLVSITDGEFAFISALLYERYGIRLGAQKKTLVAGRLSKRLRELGLSSFTRYFDRLGRDGSGAEFSELINRMTTNHSFFYREQEHFDFLRSEVLPELRIRIDRDPRYPLRIWSAGCAGGEEVYTIAMIVRDFFGTGVDAMDCGLLATDISASALEIGQRGIYAESKLGELPRSYRLSYLRREASDLYAVTPEIRRMVLFKRLNLMTDRFPFRGDFDAIFCRNVMIYFDEGSRERLVKAFQGVLRPGGFLFIGHSETIQRNDGRLEYLRPAVYRKPAA